MLKNLLRHPLLKSSLIYTISDGINKSIPFFILPVLSHFLLPEDYGLVANFGVLTGILGLIITCSIDGVISVHYNQMGVSKIRIFIFNAFLVAICLFLLIFIFIVYFHNHIYRYLEIPYSYQLICASMALFNVFTTVNLVLWRLEEKPLYFGFYEISNTILNVLLSLFLVIVFHKGWQGRVTAIALSAVIYGIFSIIFLIRRGYLQMIFNPTFFKAVIVFGLPLIPHSLSFWIRSGVDRMIITDFWGSGAVGLYATGFQFGTLVSFLIGAFNNAYSPYLYKTLSEPNLDRLEKSKKKLVKLTYAIMGGLLLCGIIFILLSKYILLYTFSETYFDALEYINWAIIGQVFQGFYLLFVNYIFFVKRTKNLALITFGCSFLQVFLTYLLVLRIGPIGAAYSSVTISFINFLLVMLYSIKVYKMPWLAIFIKKGKI